MKDIGDFSLSFKKFFPPYQEPSYINFHVMDKELLEFDSCIL